MKYPRRHWGKRLTIGLVSLCISVFVFECALRWGLASSSVPTLGDPGRYFDPLCDEDYWRALRRGAYGEGLHRVGPNDRDPILGWIPERNRLDANLALKTGGSVTDEASPISLFGDSYMLGTASDGSRISDVMDAQLPRRSVHNFGVGGYGLDQIVLRHQDRLPALSPGDVVVVGVLTTDLDRTILQVRDAPKPRFEFDPSGQLIAHPPDVDVNEDWFDRHPVQSWSLVGQRIHRTVALWRAQSNPALHPDCQRKAKEELGSALLMRLGRQCTENKLNCYLLVFYRPIDLEYGAGWRRAVLTSEYGMPVLDSWDWFQSYPDHWRTLYGQDNHPNALGNEYIAKRILMAVDLP